MGFSHKWADTRAGAHAFAAIELDGVGIFGDVISFDGSIAFDGFSVVTTNFSNSTF